MADVQKRKHQYADYSKKRKRSALEPGLKGFLCTCNVREKDCVSESYNILNEYADKLVEPVVKVDDGVDVDQLEEEIKALKSSGRNAARFQALESGAKNIVFIRTTLEDPVKLTTSIVADILESKQQKTRFLIRLVPVEITCKAYLDDIKKAVEPLVEKYFGNEPKTFSICYNHRNNNNLNKDEVISTVADMIAKRNASHKVNLKDAELSVIIEVIKNVCLLSVAPNFLKYKKYNLHSLCKGEGDAE